MTAVQNMKRTEGELKDESAVYPVWPYFSMNIAAVSDL